MNFFSVRLDLPLTRLLFLFGVAVIPEHAASQEKPLNVEDVLKNIQALKGISPADFWGLWV